ncbi:cobyric acid synthase [Calidifontibacillus erzurumensis]|uniref:Cobyric acid synthase n=1 Tax=Calidifontibacillus erzurumensis TaxID=2741433 RepID=A0A8J8GBM3_9BACI|nr:cobyric acid synthase [Calidifontibacillus erzurumensis]NSL50687.1 cobyric acid synthase [Calidifontibacillus erzurumensis]
MVKAMPIMIQGTHSDAGKSVITTGLCRIFYQDGYKTAPFKSQNMALNSYITVDGKEIGRAQGVQAEAAGVVATTDMNPILIKPNSVNESQIVVHGKPYQNMKATAYRQDFYQTGLQIIEEAYRRLENEFECIVIEGAGSPAEINLNDRELVNMRVARMANAPVILVGDIEKGGVFASLVGTLQLLSEEDRKRIIGVIINKFRGDKKLLEPGIEWFEQYTGKKVLGVVPYVHNLNIEAEDSVILDKYPYEEDVTKEIDIAVIRYPMVSNFTDVDPFFAEKDCHVRFVRNPKELGEPDLIIFPGSKNTIEDLNYLKKTGLAQSVLKLAQEKNIQVVGICGGYQMLGKKVEDPNGVETTLGSINGLGLLPVETVITTEKMTVLSEGTLIFKNRQYPVKGYEIHMGQSSLTSKPLIALENRTDGCKRDDDKIIGTYFHGLFHNDEFRHDYLNDLRIQKGLEPIVERVSIHKLREQAFDKLADHLRRHIDLSYIYEKMRQFQMD